MIHNNTDDTQSMTPQNMIPKTRYLQNTKCFVSYKTVLFGPVRFRSPLSRYAAERSKCARLYSQCVTTNFELTNGLDFTDGRALIDDIRQPEEKGH